MKNQSPLMSTWKLMFQQNITEETIRLHGSYQAAQENTLKDIGELKTVEEACSTLNSLPKISDFGLKDTILFVREGKYPSFENFPDGSRIIMDTMTQEDTKETFHPMLMAVLGENVTKKLEVDNPCHIIRVSHKPSHNNPDLVRFEVWMEKSDITSKVRDYFQNIFPDSKVDLQQLK